MPKVKIKKSKLGYDVYVDGMLIGSVYKTQLDRIYGGTGWVNSYARSSLHKTRHEAIKDCVAEYQRRNTRGAIK